MLDVPVVQTKSQGRGEAVVDLPGVHEDLLFLQAIRVSPPSRRDLVYFLHKACFICSVVLGFVCVAGRKIKASNGGNLNCLLPPECDGAGFVLVLVPVF